MTDKGKASGRTRDGDGRAWTRWSEARRREIRRTLAARRESALLEALRRPETGALALIALSFVLLTSLVAMWARETYVPGAGRVSDETRTVRVEFSIEDELATQKNRDSERLRSPRVYQADRAVIEDIESGLLRLPRTLSDTPSLDAVAPEIRERFALDEATLAALRSRFDASTGDVAASWRAAVAELVDLLKRTPILTPETHQREQLAANEIIETRTWDGAARRDHESRALNIASERFLEEMDRMVRRAGFRPDVASAVVSRLTRNARPTFTLDEIETNRLQEQAATSVAPVLVTYRVDDVLVRRGQIIDDRVRAVLRHEQRAYVHAGSRAPVWLGRLGVLGVVCAVAMGMGAYLRNFYRARSREPRRAAAVAASVFLATGITLWGAVANPGLLLFVALAPSVLLAVTLAIAFDQRMALAFAALQILIVCAALGSTIGFFLVGVVGAAAAASRLREIRNRKAILSAGAATAAAVALAVALVALVERPLAGAGVADGAAIRTVAIDAAQGAVGAMLVAFLALGLLPVIERAFDVTTGMTLIELRDPKHPLLRELAQRAPGTYTHSITVATLVEAAADAIGADGLHAYVGALYHDVGKMNKPEYFVENQSGGMNRHSKLSPAMSLLVIVGHVKDGVELAREYGLPRSIRSYIETHHGTTLVEYFFHRARERAGEQSGESPAEFGYRYPGPKPRTKEEAILMLCDAVESASRALAEPTPSRIEGLVEALASKRLMDGQFDECDLTLRELHVIEQTVIKSLNSIYHGRIAYPTAAAAPASGDARKPKTGVADAAGGAGGQPALSEPAPKGEKVG